MSLWYAAHIVMYVRRKRKPLAKLPVWENIVLIKAESEEAAFAKAEERGRQDAGDPDGFLWGGEPAEWIFAGVRKLTLCEDPEKRPGEGTEVSYLEMELPSEQALCHWLEGKPTSMKSTDVFAEPAMPNERPALKKRA